MSIWTKLDQWIKKMAGRNSDYLAGLPTKHQESFYRYVGRLIRELDAQKRANRIKKRKLRALRAQVRKNRPTEITPSPASPQPKSSCGTSNQ